MSRIDLNHRIQDFLQAARSTDIVVGFGPFSKLKLPQLLGRIMGCKGGRAEFLEAVRRTLSPPAILTERLSLTPPGAETARLEGHSGSVAALCVLPDGRLASGSTDNIIRLWDVAAGAETARLENRRAERMRCRPAASWRETPSGACTGWRSWTEVRGRRLSAENINAT